MPAKNLYRTNEEGTYSHIYNRGIEKRNIFNDEHDYKVFLGYLKDYLTAPADTESIKTVFKVNGRSFRGVPHQPKNYFNKVELIAYSLLPNYFHLLVKQKTSGSLEKLIRSLCTRYSIYYNKKYQRSGSLFHGPYKSVLVKNKEILLDLTRSFHNNTKGYTSYAEYLGERVTSWVNPTVILSSFQETFSYKNFVERYEPKENEKELFGQLERSILQPEEKGRLPEVYAEPSAKSKLRTIGFVSTSVVLFVLLFTLGIRNIKTSVAQTNISISSLPTPTPQVAGIEDEKVEEKMEPKIMVVIRISDGAESVNIRLKPSTESEKVGTAKDGDTFEFVSREGEWYQIKLDDETPAFVSTRYAEIVDK